MKRKTVSHPIAQKRGLVRQVGEGKVFWPWARLGLLRSMKKITDKRSGKEEAWC